MKGSLAIQVNIFIMTLTLKCMDYEPIHAIAVYTGNEQFTTKPVGS